MTTVTRDTSLLKGAIAKAVSVLICARDDAEPSPEYGILVVTGEGATMFQGFVSSESARNAVNEARAALAWVYSVHEAGHAVIAAHFRIPFNYVVSGSLGQVEIPAPYLTLQNLSGSAAMDFVRHSAVMLCASRAAVDEILPGQGQEFHYTIDEDDLEEIASILGVNRSEFSSWRLALLGEARRLVAQSDIRATIIAVARELNKPFTGKMAAKEVEAMLKSACVASQEAEAHATTQEEENNADIQ